MRIDRIHFEQLFPTGVYANQRLRAEASIDELDNISECYKKLQQEVENAFVKLNPQIKWEDIKTEEVVVEPPITDKIDAFISTINYCTNKTMLERFRPQVEREKNEKLTQAFENKLKTFI